MRILLVNKNWRITGGVETFLFAVRDLLEELGHEIVPFAMADPDNEPAETSDYFVTNVDFRSGGVGDRLRAAGRAVAGVQTVRRLGALLDDHPVDAALVLHGYHQLGTTFLRLLERRRVPTVLSVHDYKLGCPSYRLFDDRTGQICTRCFDSPIAHAWAPVTVRCWDGSALGGAVLSLEAVASRMTRSYTRGPGAVMTVNRLQRDGVRRMGVRDDRIHVVPHFADIDSAAPLARREGHVVYVGRLVPEKGVDVLIRAVAAEGLSVRIVGDGRDRAALESLARDLGADATFVGAVSHGTVLTELHRGSVAAVPSIWHEVWGLVVHEAWQAGLPVVGTRVGGLRDLLDDGRGIAVAHGDHVELGRALRHVVDDADAANGMVRRARAWATTELSRERFLERLRAVFATVGVSI